MSNNIIESRVAGVRKSTRTLGFCAIPHGSGEQPYAVVLRHIPNTPARPYVVYNFRMESGAFDTSKCCATLADGYRAFAARVAKCGLLYSDRVDATSSHRGSTNKWVDIRHGWDRIHPFVNLNDESREEVARMSEEKAGDHDA